MFCHRAKSRLIYCDTFGYAPIIQNFTSKIEGRKEWKIFDVETSQALGVFQYQIFVSTRPWHNVTPERPFWSPENLRSFPENKIFYGMDIKFYWHLNHQFINVSICFGTFHLIPFGIPKITNIELRLKKGWFRFGRVTLSAIKTFELCSLGRQRIIIFF